MMDLTEIVLLNENPDHATPGDVQIFRNSDAACRFLEHWWVEAGYGAALTASGDRLTLGVDERDRVMVTNREPAHDGVTLVHNWVHAAATAVLEARRWKAARGKVALSPSEQQGRLPASLEELIAYVGFHD